MSLSALVDLRPLRQTPDFRRLWIGTTASMFGGQLASFAITYHVWELTKSPAMVGALGIAIATPLIILGLVGGSVADAMDRRRLVIITTIGQFSTAATMAVLALLDVQAVWVYFLLVAITSGFGGAGAPARRTFVPRLLPREQLSAGLALNHMSFQAALLLGPAAAGMITARWGTATCFVIDAVTFLIAGYGIARLPRMRPLTVESRPGARAIANAVRLTVRRPVLGGAFVTDLCATVLAMPMALFPVLNAEKFGGSPETLGLFLSAVGLGGIAASVLSGFATRSPRSGMVMLLAAATWGLSLIGVGLINNLAAVLALLAIAGAADTWSVISRGGIVQMVTPDAYRGRVSALEHIVGAAGPHIGNVRGGLVASLSSAGVSLVVGGALCLVGLGLVAHRVPALRQFDTRAEPDPGPHRKDS